MIVSETSPLKHEGEFHLQHRTTRSNSSSAVFPGQEMKTIDPTVANGAEKPVGTQLLTSTLPVSQNPSAAEQLPSRQTVHSGREFHLVQWPPFHRFSCRSLAVDTLWSNYR